MPVTLISPPETMKNGMASSVEESTPEVRFCDTVSIIRSPCGEIVTMVP
jgi:hypothetical protein